MYACVYSCVHTHTRVHAARRSLVNLVLYSSTSGKRKNIKVLLLLCSNNHTRLENFTMSVKLISKYPLKYKNVCILRYEFRVNQYLFNLLFISLSSSSRRKKTCHSNLKERFINLVCIIVQYFKIILYAACCVRVETILTFTIAHNISLK